MSSTSSSPGSTNDPTRRDALVAVRHPDGKARPLRKFLMIFAIAACLVLSVIGGLVPILQGWIFLVIALYLLATEFVVGRRMVIWARRRWPGLSHLIFAASKHRWAPKHLREFEELTDPTQ